MIVQAKKPVQASLAVRAVCRSGPLFALTHAAIVQVDRWIDLLFFRLAPVPGVASRSDEMGVAVDLSVLSNNNHAGDRLLDHVDDRVLDRHLHHSSWRFSWCLPCRDLRWPLFLADRTLAPWTLPFSASCPLRPSLRAGSALGLPRFRFYASQRASLLWPSLSPVNMPPARRFNQANSADIILFSDPPRLFFPASSG